MSEADATTYIRELAGKIDRLITLVDGNPQTDHVGMRQKLREMGEQMDVNHRAVGAKIDANHLATQAEIKASEARQAADSKALAARVQVIEDERAEEKLVEKTQRNYLLTLASVLGALGAMFGSSVGSSITNALSHLLKALVGAP